MASLRMVKDSYFVRFRLAGRQFERGVGCDPRRAEAALTRVEATLLDIKNGRISLPDDADIAQFVVSDGETTAKPKLPEILTLADLFRRFEDALPEGAMEPNSLRTHRIHRNHLTRILGGKVAAQSISTAELQAYVNMRCKEGRERDTINKEVSTFGSIWTWATLQDLLTGPCRTRGLKYPKAKDKPPFLTWDEIEAAVSRGGMADEQIGELWDCLFLDTDQIAETLAHVKAAARLPFVYPMFAFVALTGCRRSEMIRSQREDIKVGTRRVSIREKKRDRSVTVTYRYVTMHPFLAQVMQEWSDAHPGGRYTFCQHPNLLGTRYDTKRALPANGWLN
jgi:integrase